MADAPQFDSEQYREEIRRRLEGLGERSCIAFAARCAWRAAPALLWGWSDRAQRHAWLEQYLPVLQAALVVSLLRSGSDRISDDLFASSGSFSGDLASKASDASVSRIAAFASASISYSAHSVSYHSTDDLLFSGYDPLGHVSNAVAALGAMASAISSETLENVESEIAADIIWLKRNKKLGGSTLWDQPLWTSRSAELESVWTEWMEIVNMHSAAGEFCELAQNIWRGNLPWERLQEIFNAWWNEHSEETSRGQGAESRMRGNSGELSAPRIRRIIQQRLVSTTSVTTDGEAERLTPTARNCMLALREFLVSDETLPPLTVAVEAPWGGGKSSLMRHLQDALTNDSDATTKQRPFKEESIPTVWFNPWKHEAGKTLWAAFAVAFERQMAERCSRWERTKKRTRLAWQRLEMTERVQLVLRLAFWVVAFISLACLAWQQTHTAAVADWKERLMQHAPWLGMIVTVWAFLKDAVKQLGSPLKLDVSRLLTHNDHADKVDDLHRFHEDFRRLMHAYIPKRGDGKPGKAVVFIDDLDRCEAPKAAELLQSLHQMLNVHERSRVAADKNAPGVICVLGMDREKVAAAVAAKHEKLLPLLVESEANGKVSRANAMIFGHEFLEKFIQLTLHLPAMQGNDLNEYLQSITGAKLTTTTHKTESKTEQPPSSSAASTPTMVGAETATSPPATSDAKIQEMRESLERKETQERIDFVNEDLRDGNLALQCAQYVAAALENNPRKLKQFVNLFRLRLYLAAAMNFLDLPDRDDGESEAKPPRSASADKLSPHQLAKLVALELAAPSEMTNVREKPSSQLFAALQSAFPETTKPALNALVSHRDSKEPEAYDLEKVALEVYFHYFKPEAPTTSTMAA